MKVKKDELELLTKNAVTGALLGMTALTLSRCPEESFYQIYEDSAKQADAMRVNLGLTPLAPVELTNGLFRKLALKLIHILDDGERRKAVEGIGFKIPTKPEEMN